MRAWVLALLLSPALASAQQTAAADARPEHQLSAYLSMGATAHVSPVRTQGGLGLGVGIRDTLRGHLLLQADINQLLLVGNVTLVRVGAGLQREGTYSPAVLLTLGAFLGDHLTFITPEHPRPVRGPTLALGAVVAPLRFTAGPSQISVLQLGLGLGSEGAAIGLAYQLGLLEMGLAF